MRKMIVHRDSLLRRAGVGWGKLPTVGEHPFLSTDQECWGSPGTCCVGQRGRGPFCSKELSWAGRDSTRQHPRRRDLR